MTTYQTGVLPSDQPPVTLHGQLVAVSQTKDGDQLVAAAAVGDSTLFVGDVADFDEEGGWLSWTAKSSSTSPPTTTSRRSSSQTRWRPPQFRSTEPIRLCMCGMRTPKIS